MSRRPSIASTTSTTSTFINENEMFSGAASEVIPSSITSLHYPHHFSRRSSENSPLLEAHSIHSRLSAESDTGNFRFFSPDEIETAQGGSTIENTIDPIDYNTDWDYNNDKYDTIPESDHEDHGDLPSQHSVTSFSRFRDRRSSHSSETSDISRDVEMPDYPARRKQQRFYLAEEDLVIGIAGYTDCLWKKAILYLLSILTLGLGYIVLRWFPRYRVNLMGNRSPLGTADWVVVENERGELTIARVSRTRLNEPMSTFLPLHTDEKDPILPAFFSFSYRYTKFFYDPVEDLFRTNAQWHDPRWTQEPAVGISYRTHEQRLQVFGENSIEIEEKPVGRLLVDEVLHPFYVFQVFSVFLWLADDYYYYASCIFVISLVSIVNSLVETRTTIRRLQSMSRFSCDVRVWRQGFWKQTDSRQLVPGDVFEVDASMSVVPCDALLLNGECMLNESMLTGESVPVTKVPPTPEALQALPEGFVSPQLARSYLYNGTALLRTRSDGEPVCAMVVKTGFSTTKGALVRSMLFPKPTDFKFYRDSFRYIGFMALIALVGFTYSTYNFLQLGLPVRLIVLRALDIITIVVPPALPATLTIGSTFAVNRLKQSGIFCVAPTKVNVGGRLDVVCFDKTGTLTEDGLDVLGVHVSNNAQGTNHFVFSPLQSSLQNSLPSDQHDYNNGAYLLACMACCHSLRSVDGELLGDPLDLKSFGFSGWALTENGGIAVHDPNWAASSYAIVSEFEFVSGLRRMSVVSQDSSAKYVFTKGAPEVMAEICDPSTLPPDYEDTLFSYTHKGYRVIACAYKRIKKKHEKELQGPSARSFAESSLVFAGFIVFENKLKPRTKASLQALARANIRTIMCTGDNILTAVSVAKECALVDPLAEIFLPSFENGVLRWSLDGEYLDLSRPRTRPFLLATTGDVFRYLLTELKDPHMIRKVLAHCAIYARMSPDEKHELVSQLQQINYTVGFCGDGANDCGALKAADVGISLSEAEASVAAPFTSRVFDISCVIHVIREGRAALVTSFACFKYMSLYSAIQFISVTILYKRGVNLGDFQFLYIDMFLILPLAIFMSWAKPYPVLCVKRPTANLVSPAVLVPLVLHIATLAAFQIALWWLVQLQPWYIAPIPGADDAVQSSDNTVLFLFSNLQYILIAVVLSVGPPYRESMWKNRPFVVNLVLSTLLSVMLFCVGENSALGRLLQLTNLSASFYVLMLVAGGVNLAVMGAVQNYTTAKLDDTSAEPDQYDELERSEEEQPIMREFEEV